MGPFETFREGAGLKLIARGRNREDLFANAARGLTSVLAGGVAVHPGSLRERFRLEAPDGATLLLRWLGEILLLFSGPREVFGAFSFSVLSDTLLDAELGGELQGPGRLGLGAEIKAVAVRGAEIVRVDDGWEARVALDV